MARHYLGHRPEIDTLILGCTHYPVLEDVIQRVTGRAVSLVSSAEVTAEMVKRALAGEARAPDGAPGRITHYVTGDVLALVSSPAYSPNIYIPHLSREDAEREDRLFWHSKTPAERLAAAEQLRQVAYGYDAATARIQAVVVRTVLKEG